MLLLLHLLFESLDHFVERLDDAIFDSLYGSPARPKLQSATNVFHPPRDVIERFVFQALTDPAASDRPASDSESVDLLRAGATRPTSHRPDRRCTSR